MTGYPADLLDPDLDLEADLGVDTVKQAEVFAAVRAQWNLERDDTLQLREFPTLNHVAGWVRGKLGEPEPATPQPPGDRHRRRPLAAALPATRPRPRPTPVLDTVTGIVAEMTGYPADLLDPDLDLEADLGVDTVKQAEVFAAVRARGTSNATTPSSCASSPPSTTSPAGSAASSARPNPTPAADTASPRRPAAATPHCDRDRARGRRRPRHRHRDRRAR